MKKHVRLWANKPYLRLGLWTIGQLGPRNSSSTRTNNTFGFSDSFASLRVKNQISRITIAFRNLVFIERLGSANFEISEGSEAERTTIHTNPELE